MARTHRCVILALSLLASNVAGGASNHGITAYLQGSYAKAIPALRHDAHHGFAPSQFYLGMVYLHGRGVEVDRALAYAWFAAGERNGHSPSRNARRLLHVRLKIGELPRAERLAREFMAQFSSPGYNAAPCYSNVGEQIIKRCGPPPA